MRAKIFSGFRFGLLLQFAVGPISLYIFKVAVSAGFFKAFVGTIAVTLADSLFIIAAIIGIGTLLEKYSGFKKFLTYFGGAILILFGISIVVATIQSGILKDARVVTEASIGKIALEAFVLTAANPLTILFWAGVFSTKVADEGMDRRAMYGFGIGAALSTLICLSLLAIIGDFFQVFLTPEIMFVLNIVVGLVLVYFGAKVVAKDRKTRVVE